MKNFRVNFLNNEAHLSENCLAKISAVPRMELHTQPSCGLRIAKMCGTLCCVLLIFHH